MKRNVRNFCDTNLIDIHVKGFKINKSVATTNILDDLVIGRDCEKLLLKK